jgi:cation diffusion facilitator CzcD-associated flavoprotein CzcO
MKMMGGMGGLLNEIEIDEKENFTPAQIERFKSDPELYKKFADALEDDAGSKFAIVLNRTSPQQQWAFSKAREFMAAMLGGDERLCKALIPTFPVGCRRLTPAPGYLESMRAPNVDVVTDKIRRFVAEGMELETGEMIKVDAIICATGFDHSFRPPFPVMGREGNLQDLWGKETPKAYMSLAIPGMPNYFSEFPFPHISAADPNKLLRVPRPQRTHCSRRCLQINGAYLRLRRQGYPQMPN